MKEIALDLTNNDYRIITKQNGCFDSSGNFLKKYKYINGILCAVDSNENILQTYRKCSFEEASEIFNIPKELSVNYDVSVLIKVINNDDIQPYLFFNSDNSLNKINMIKEYLSQTEINNLDLFLSQLPDLSLLYCIIFAPKESGNWVYLNYTCDFEVQ